MGHSLLRHQDFISGGLFCLTGLAVAATSSRYPLGTAMRMGAGYFPQLLGGLLAALGAFVLLRALLRRGTGAAVRIRLRPLFLVGGGILAFAGLLGGVGLAGATLALVCLSGAAHHQSRLGELLALGLALAGFSVSVFVWGLGLPLPVLPV